MPWNWCWLWGFQVQGIISQLGVLLLIYKKGECLSVLTSSVSSVCSQSVPPLVETDLSHVSIWKYPKYV